MLLSGAWEHHSSYVHQTAVCLLHMEVVLWALYQGHSCRHAQSWDVTRMYLALRPLGRLQRPS